MKLMEFYPIPRSVPVMISMVVPAWAKWVACPITLQWISTISLRRFGWIWDWIWRKRIALRRPHRGRDLQVRVDLTFEEAVFGVEKTIELTCKMKPVAPAMGLVQNQVQIRSDVRPAVGGVKYARSGKPFSVP